MRRRGCGSRRAFNRYRESFAAHDICNSRSRCLLVLSLPTDGICYAFQAISNADGNELLAGNENISFLDEMVEPQLERVDIQEPRDVIHF